MAWAVLVTSFAIWVGLLLALPLAVNSMLQNATRPLVLEVQANEGTVGLADGNGQRDAIFVGEPARAVEGSASLLTNTTDTALVNVLTPDEGQLLSRLLVYGNTGVDVDEANAPRFAVSDHRFEMKLSLSSGRVHITIPDREGRTMVVRINTPQEGEIILEDPGQYSLAADNVATGVVVQEGEAFVRAGEDELTLIANQRALLPADGPLSGPLSSERELVHNGDFNDGMKAWTPLAWKVELPDQMEGATSVINIGGEEVLRFHRVGRGHADAELRQVINQDVTDFESLQMFVTMRIADQSLGVCGVQGSECPLFVRINYVDIYGNQQTWQQGFFSVGEIVAGSTPDVCQFCGAPNNPHIRVPPNQIYFYESQNLLQELAEQNIKPRVIESLSLVASGHTFETQVVDVSLIADE
jgi:hypothetical protein